MVASGIRVGTPAVTTRGMGEAEMERVADLIARALAAPDDDASLSRVRADVEALCREFPRYPETLGLRPRGALDAVGPRGADHTGKVSLP
jgi:glycine hydroxymethyltransferase